MRFARSLLVSSLALAITGCFLMSRSPQQPDSKAVSGPVPYVENCAACHAGPTTAHYAESRHAG
jgi:mono/diheme cytochrome c family protein